MATDSLADEWSDRWVKGQSRWHLTRPHPKLLAHLHLLTQDRDPQAAGVIFVPLCGKSRDMDYLYQQGFQVLGAECCEQVIVDFFSEIKVEPVTEVKEDLKTFSSQDGRLKILCGDIFKLTRTQVSEPVQMVWDRAALVAVTKEQRKAYATTVGDLLAPGGRYLLCTTQYREWFHSGPPYNTPPELVELLYRDRFQVRLLESAEMNKDEYLDIGQEPGKENMHLLVRKPA